MLRRFKRDDPAQVVHAEGGRMQLRDSARHGPSPQHYGSSGSVWRGVRPLIPDDCLPYIMGRCWDANPEIRPPLTEILTMLERAETEVMTTVRKAMPKVLCSTHDIWTEPVLSWNCLISSGIWTFLSYMILFLLFYPCVSVCS